MKRGNRQARMTRTIWQVYLLGSGLGHPGEPLGRWALLAAQTLCMKMIISPLPALQQISLVRHSIENNQTSARKAEISNHIHVYDLIFRNSISSVDTMEIYSFTAYVWSLFTLMQARTKYTQKQRWFKLSVCVKKTKDLLVLFVFREYSLIMTSGVGKRHANIQIFWACCG